jgi:hypothetical protein
MSWQTQARIAPQNIFYGNQHVGGAGYFLRLRFVNFSDTSGTPNKAWPDELLAANAESEILKATCGQSENSIVFVFKQLYLRPSHCACKR